MKMAEITSVDVCQESSNGFFYKKELCADNNPSIVKDTTSFLLKISFHKSACAVLSRIPPRYNNCTVKCGTVCAWV